MTTPAPPGPNMHRTVPPAPPTHPCVRHEPRWLAVLECVVNVSEGRDDDVLDRAGGRVRPRSARPPPRSATTIAAVLTLVGRGRRRERVATAGRRAARPPPATTGVHPRLGVVDVVPFVPLAGAHADRRRRGPRRLRRPGPAAELALPCFRYGPERTLPEVRRRAFARPGARHRASRRPTRPPGRRASGARAVLVAYNVWLAEPDLAARPPGGRRGPGPGRAGARPSPSASGCR